MNDLIKTAVPLQNKNWFQTGGNAEFYAEPRTTEQLQEAISFAHTHTLAITILGNGANVLISDAGVKGLVIHPALTYIHSDSKQHTITAEAGVLIQELIDWGLEHNMLCMQEFSGIPGTIGGATYMNIHYFKNMLSDHLLHAVILDIKNNTLQTVDNAWFSFGYDQSTLQQKQHVLVSATFQAYPATDLKIAYEKGKRDERIVQRNNRYPSSHTCGSFFKNVPENTVKQDAPTAIAYYLERARVKGSLCVGGARVSPKHANMIINNKSATTHDIVTLAQKMQQAVFEQFGITPKPECQFLGFTKKPL